MRMWSGARGLIANRTPRAERHAETSRHIIDYPRPAIHWIAAGTGIVHRGVEVATSSLHNKNCSLPGFRPGRQRQSAIIQQAHL